MYRNFLAATMLVLGLVIIVPALAQADDGEPGVVYAMTNADDGNEIVVYNRAANGTLTLAGTFPTGGSGRTTEPGDALGAQHPLILSPGHRWLFAVNAGSNEISVFKAGGVGLTLVDVVPSGGYFPASLTIYQDWLYVLNAGGEGNITGFTLDPSGHLTPLPGSTRSLQAGGMNPPEFLESPAEVGFSPLGDWLVVTVKGPHEPEPMHQIHLFAVDSNGLPSEHPITSTFEHTLPFGFAFDDLDHLLVAEPFGNIFEGVPVGGASAASSYTIAPDGALVPISTSVPNFQTATCWIEITANTRFAYTTNNVTNTISSYKVGPDGSLSLIKQVAAMTGHAPVDLAITPNGQYLYNVNAGTDDVDGGTVSMFKINQLDGNLTSLGQIGGLPMDGSAVGIAAF